MEGTDSRASEAKRSILLVAGLDRAHYFKGVGVLLEAVAALPGTAHLTIVGDGDLRPEYEERARALGIGHRTRFAGRVTDDALPGYYRRADVTVLPSVTMGEAFGMVLVESLACGTPVIATDLPGVRTVVDRECTGLLVPPGDASQLGAALARLLNDDATRERYGREGVHQVHACYTWERIGDQLERLYHIVLRDQQREGNMGFWDTQRVVVTGGAGFLGSYVVCELVQRSCEAIFIPRSKDYDLRTMEAVRRLYG